MKTFDSFVFIEITHALNFGEYEFIFIVKYILLNLEHILLWKKILLHFHDLTYYILLTGINVCHQSII